MPMITVISSAGKYPAKVESTNKTTMYSVKVEEAKSDLTRTISSWLDSCLYQMDVVRKTFEDKQYFSGNE